MCPPDPLPAPSHALPQEGEVVDCSTLNVAALTKFAKATMVEAKAEGVLLSLHMKATMMKVSTPNQPCPNTVRVLSCMVTDTLRCVSDPIVFGHVVRAYYEAAFEKHADTFRELNVTPNFGIETVLAKVQAMDDKAKAAEIEADINACYADQC
eukprot:9481339-Pyramimonas_sp.AAC.1